MSSHNFQTHFGFIAKSKKTWLSLYLSLWLLSSRDTAALPPSIMLSEPNRSLYKHFNPNDYTLLGRRTNFFLTMNEVKDDMKWMIENMKLHEVGGLKVENVGGIEIWKTREPRENSLQSSHCSPQYCLPGDTETRTLDLIKDRRAI